MINDELSYILVSSCVKVCFVVGLIQDLAKYRSLHVAYLKLLSFYIIQRNDTLTEENLQQFDADEARQAPHLVEGTVCIFKIVIILHHSKK